MLIPANLILHIKVHKQGNKYMLDTNPQVYHSTITAPYMYPYWHMFRVRVFTEGSLSCQSTRSDIPSFTNPKENFPSTLLTVRPPPRPCRFPLLDRAETGMQGHQGLNNGNGGRIEFK